MEDRVTHAKEVIVLLLCAALLPILPYSLASATTDSTACPSTFNLQVPNSIPPGMTTLSVITSTTTTVAEVKFEIDGQPLGRGVIQSSGSAMMQWFTLYSPPGAHSIGASVTFADGNGCFIPPKPTTLTHTTTASGELTAFAVPSQYQGSTNQVINFGLQAKTSTTSGSLTDVTPYTYFNKAATSIGAISPLDGSPTARYSTGPAAGSGTIAVSAYYGGLHTTIDIPVQIQALVTNGSTMPSSSTNQSTQSSETTTSPSTLTAKAIDQANAAASTASIEAEAPLKDCVQTKLGADRYTLIGSGAARPTAAEFENFNQCFAARNFVLPSGFVPVAPIKVKEQPQTNEVTVEQLQNQGDGVTTTLTLKGKAKPNTLVLLYIYSEPLVLSTVADGNGDWSYTLEDPLEPGTHEVYAVVNAGDGTYQRSSVFDFVIEKAEALPSNPDGLSLQLKEDTIQPTAGESHRSTTLYIIGIAILTGLMLAIGTLFLLYHRKHRVGFSNSQPAVMPQQAVSSPAPESTAPVQQQTEPPVTPTPPPANQANQIADPQSPQEKV